MTRAKDISKIVTDADLSGTLDVTGAFTSQGIDDNANATAITIDSSENVGIGTSSPQRPLHVDGLEGVARFTSTASGNNGFEVGIGSSSQAFLWQSENSYMQFATNATERMRIDSSGNVGIGTSSPAQLLHVQASGSGNGVIRLGGNAGLEISHDNAGNTLQRLDSLYRTTANDTNLQLRTGTLTFHTGTSSTERMRIDSSGNVGIGTVPSAWNTFTASLQIDGASLSGLGANNTALASNAYYDSAWKYYGTGSASLYQQNSGLHRWDIASSGTAGNTISFSEAMRIDSSGILLVGKTAVSNTAKGFAVTQSGEINSTITTAGGGNQNLFLNREDADGNFITFRKANVTAGNISVATVGSAVAIGIGHSDSGLYFDNVNNCVSPFDINTNNINDDFVSLGVGSARFDNVFATNGTIQTSDRNEKQDIEELSEAEQRVAVVAKGLMRKFRWKSAVAEKGDNARTHFGIIAQDLQDAFTAEGLDASKYAMFCSDTWWEKEISVDAVEADEENGIEAKDAYTYMDNKDEATEGYTEKTRLGVRYNQLLAFIISAI